MKINLKLIYNFIFLLNLIVYPKVLLGQDQESQGDLDDLAWDSYVESNEGGRIENDVTNGIRVEDIIEKPYKYHYASFGKGDPFIPPILTTESDNSNAMLEIPIVSILQEYSTGDLKLVGWWELKTGERKAFIMTPKDEGVITVVGDVIGNKGGKVINIGEGEIAIREFSLARDGTREFSDVILQEVKEDEKKDKIIMKANSADDEGYTPEELLPIGILDKDEDIVAREEAGKRKLIEAANVDKNKKPGNVRKDFLKAMGINLNAAPEGEVNQLQDNIKKNNEEGINIPPKNPLPNKPTPQKGTDIKNQNELKKEIEEFPDYE